MSANGFPRLLTSGPPSAPCLVLGNALGTDGRLWHDFERGVRSNLRIVRFDYPGHGGSEEWGYDSIFEISRALLAALDLQRIDRFFYCGISMGGAVGMELALAAPQRLQGLVLGNTAAQFGPQDFWDRRILQAQQEGVASLADVTVRRWLTPEAARRAPTTVSLLHSMFSATSLRGYTLACRAVASFDARDRIGSIHAPTLVLAGRHDEATPPAQARQLHHAIAGSHYLELPAAHLAPVGCPEDFTWALERFITSYQES